MRPRVALLLALACLLAVGCQAGQQKAAGDGPAAESEEVAVHGLRPTRGSARGGVEVCVWGPGMGQAAQLWFGDHARPVDRTGENEACSTTAPGLAGAVEVHVELPGALRLAAGVYSVEPLELAFAEAPPHYAPPPTGDLVSGLVADLDDDGLDDILTLDATGTVATWRSVGTGALVDGGPVEPQGPVGGLALVEGDGAPRVFLCHTSGEAPRLVDLDAGGLHGEVGTSPPEAADCTGAAAVDLEGDGADEVIELRADGSARLWAIEDGVLVPALALEAVPLDDCPAVEHPPETTTECAVFGGVASLVVDGGEAAFVHSLPAFDRRDDGFLLELGGGVDRVEVTDDAGTVWTWVPEGVGSDGAVYRVVSPPVSSWERAEGRLRPTLPLRTLAVVALAPTGTRRTELRWGGGALRLKDGGEVPVARFESWPPDLVGELRDAASVDTDGDGLPELVLATASGPALLEQVDGALVPASSGRLSAVGCDARAVRVVDVDGDGRDELFFTCSGQDLLFRGDGAGHYFEDSAASLPVDAGDGQGVVAPDLDLDGLPELVIATWDGVDRLYHGSGQRFEDWSARLGIRPGPGTTPLALDLDADRDLDLVVLQGDGLPARVLMMTGE